MKKLQIILAGVVVVIGVMASLLIHRRTESRVVEKDALLEQRASELAALTAEQRRLSNLVAGRVGRTDTNTIEGGERTSELAELRAKIEALREQTNALAQVAEHRRTAGAQLYHEGDFNLGEHSREKTITFAGGPRATGKLNDARALTAALRKYAGEHQGVFPQSLNEITAYLPKPLEPDSKPWANAPVSGTNHFEIVYHGSQHELFNIPPRRIALIRERYPWLTPEGKWARVYGYADGAASIVESDDNFQSWDAQHVLPRPNGAQ